MPYHDVRRRPLRRLRGRPLDRPPDHVRLALGRLQRTPLQHSHLPPPLGARQGPRCFSHAKNTQLHE